MHTLELDFWGATMCCVYIKYENYQKTRPQNSKISLFGETVSAIAFDRWL